MGHRRRRGLASGAASRRYKAGGPLHGFAAPKGPALPEAAGGHEEDGGGASSSSSSSSGGGGGAGAGALAPLPLEAQRAVSGAGLPAPVEAAVLRALRSRRGFIAQSPRKLARALARWGDMVGLLGGEAAAVKVLARRPDLFGRRPESLVKTIDGIQELLRLSGRPAATQVVQSFPELLARTAPALSRRVEALAAALGLERDGALQLAAKQPSLLFMDAKEVKRKLGSLAVALQLPTTEARDVLLQRPMLLNLSKDALASKARALRSLDGLPAAPASEVAARAPGVLLLSTAKLKQRWQYLRLTAAASPRWRAELAALSASSLGSLLCSGDRRLARLRYLHAEGRATGVPLYRSVVMADDAFERRFASYPAWAARQLRAWDEGEGKEGRRRRQEEPQRQ